MVGHSHPRRYIGTAVCVPSIYTGKTLVKLFYKDKTLVTSQICLYGLQNHCTNGSVL